jgi:radical SAM superfamily enzyme YgiQ (UPF0313 family)
MKRRIGLVQINNSFSGQNYLPYSAGILQAYAQQNLKRPEDFEFLLPLYTRLPVEEAVSRLEGTDAAFFSAYVWNVRISLEVARALKARRPETLVVFGGPQVPDRCEEFLRANRFIDLVTHGEGEAVFTAVLENLDRAKWRDVPSVSYLDADGRLVETPKAARLTDLSVIPSPYLSGVFDPLMRAYPEEKWIALWETNRGCPFSCTFCDWGSATQTRVYSFDLPRIFDELEWFAKHKIEFIFCADANFGILPRDLEIARRAAETKREFGYPHALSVQNTKNATERAYEVQKTLATAGLNKGVTISFQSVDPLTLKSIKRANISTKSFQELQRRFTRDRIETYSDIILGLPGETYASFVEGVSTVIENGQHNRIQFNNLSILPNAEMGDPEYQKRYGMVTIESKVINVHGSLAEADGEVHETQQLVVATDSMPREDWVRTRAFCWWTALLHFDKVFQIPLTLLRQKSGLSYRELIEAFSEGNLGAFQTLDEIKTSFLDKAKDIQNGGPEYCRSEQFLNIWWPADELQFIQLCTQDKLGRFYEEAEELMEWLLSEKGLSMPKGLLHEAIELNRHLVKRPFQDRDVRLDLSYNIWEFYRSVLDGAPVELLPKASRHHIDRTGQTWTTWNDWCREVVWFGNKKGAYLYGFKPELQLAGHF